MGPELCNGSHATLYYSTLRLTLLHYATLYYATLYNAALFARCHSSALRYIILHCAPLSYTMPHSPTLCHTLLHYSHYPMLDLIESVWTTSATCGHLHNMLASIYMGFYYISRISGIILLEGRLGDRTRVTGVAAVPTRPPLAHKVPSCDCIYMFQHPKLFCTTLKDSTLRPTLLHHATLSYTEPRYSTHKPVLSEVRVK